mgnify:CR=1 FL=1
MTTYEEKLRYVLKESVRSILLEQGDAKIPQIPLKGGETPIITVPTDLGIHTQQIFKGDHGSLTLVTADRPATVKEVFTDFSPILTITAEEFQNILDLVSNPKTHVRDFFGGLTIGVYAPIIKDDDGNPIGVDVLDTGQSADQAIHAAQMKDFGNHATNGTVGPDGTVIPGNVNIEIHQVDEVVDDEGNVVESFLYEAVDECDSTWNVNGLSQITGSFGTVTIFHHPVLHPTDKEGGIVSISINGGVWTRVETDKFNNIPDQTVQIGDTGVYVLFQYNGKTNEDGARVEVGTSVMVSTGDKLGSSIPGYVVTVPGGYSLNRYINALAAVYSVSTGGDVGGVTDIIDVDGDIILPP